LQHHRAGIDLEFEVETVGKLARPQGIILEDAAPDATMHVVRDELVVVVLENDPVLARLQLRLLARVVEEGEKAIAFLLQIPIASGQRDRQEQSGREHADNHDDDEYLDQREATLGNSSLRFHTLTGS